MTDALFPELSAILDRALQQSPRMIQRNLEALQKEYEIKVSSSRLYPQVGASVSFDYQREDRTGTIGESQRLLYDIGASYPLISWGEHRAASEAGKIVAAFETNEVVESYRILALEIRRLYLDLVIAKSNLRNLQFDLDRRRDRLELTLARAEAGEIPRNMIGAAQKTFDEGELAFDRAGASFDGAVRRFRTLTGVDEFGPDSIPAEIPPIPSVQDAAIDELEVGFVDEGGLEKTVRYINGTLGLEKARRDEKIIAVSQRPKLGFRTGFRRDELNYSTDVTNVSYLQTAYAGVRLSWNIFDGMATRGRRMSALARISLIEHNMQALEGTLKNEAEAAAQELGFAERSLDLAERSFADAVNISRSVEENLEFGLVSQDQVRDALGNRYTAEIAIFRARAAYLNALASFVSAVNADPRVAALPVRTGTS